ncbi:hypothetical protein M427DRAFT_51901 [Gonapodya prolifera JEL478]|uniref:SET domain-containing protein n=1 Tax=Gonapodya prolifera (strain JEL478) TaxID=1344416 RepID=A0A139AW49_GONPJ|nr:hypothetical protein M427DRAFT_51901 [Gonapodya prolifera JEL478]|eukprot:KXS20950.1 hypothetical protein M427DRAFT_51901 [Gonapodya prolifera JEL478]
MSTAATVHSLPLDASSLPTSPQNVSGRALKYPDLFEIVFGDNLSSKLVVKRKFKKGEPIVKLEGLTKAPKKYTSVQIGADEHIELNSELVFMNHSCSPSVTLDIPNRCVVANKDFAAGDEATFFYPSTEWEMDQPFECWCGSADCVRIVRGAKFLPRDRLDRYILAPHIHRLIENDR